MTHVFTIDEIIMCIPSLLLYIQYQGSTPQTFHLFCNLFIEFQIKINGIRKIRQGDSRIPSLPLCWRNLLRIDIKAAELH